MDHRTGGLAGLIAWIAHNCPSGGLAVDCGAGLGETSVFLGLHFSRVVSIDANAACVTMMKRLGVAGAIRGEAENLPIGNSAADLVFTFQALHEFDRTAFIDEAWRVLRPGGLFAALCYGKQILPGALAKAMRRYENAVEPYWEAARPFVVGGYRDLSLAPFRELRPPASFLERRLTRPQFEAYLNSWTATRKYIAERGRPPDSPAFAETFGGAGGRVSVGWPIVGRVGRKPWGKGCRSGDRTERGPGPACQPSAPGHKNR